ncbi:hypothetical protein CLV24_11969 [Pontibacter ummariensis]|uniref:Uncharacterized protein n=1 Tax=Pontibacter ummariensis TaxID=1610492 RepID=A0A239IXU7_9BACT|nr:hypothetical protein CLV24_11969 [Pontibacter ummariensis]SNS98441.1 hypothetical protein SAMN06296052_11969 [Pontibacter ummariensis]
MQKGRFGTGEGEKFYCLPAVRGLLDGSIPGNFWSVDNFFSLAHYPIGINLIHSCGRTTQE